MIVLALDDKCLVLEHDSSRPAICVPRGASPPPVIVLSSHPEDVACVAQLWHSVRAYEDLVLLLREYFIVVCERFWKSNGPVKGER